jgi:hypothetical protein
MTEQNSAFFPPSHRVKRRSANSKRGATFGPLSLAPLGRTRGSALKRCAGGLASRTGLPSGISRKKLEAGARFELATFAL